MKIILTQADFRTAIADFLAKQGINVNTDVADIDTNDIEIDLNPEQSTGATKPVQQRKRRTKAEIEAEEAKARVNPVYETPDPVPTAVMGSAKEASALFGADEDKAVGTRTVDVLDEPEETLGSIVDTLVEASSKPKREEPDSLFG